MREGILGPVMVRPAQAIRLFWPGPRLIATMLILGSIVARLAYLTNHCPLQLAPDEAHYWDWSRHLDWSYYSKGPLVAWLIRLSCELFGGLSEQLVGTPMLAVRIPALLCSAGFLTGVYVLTLRTFRSDMLALAVIVVAFSMPVVAAGGTVMTIDAPYTCLWSWALVFGYNALFRRQQSAWMWVGLTVGLGILAKYTMVFWFVGLFLFLMCTPPFRNELRRSGVWIAVGVAAICCLPIVIWNIQHDWITIRHVGTQAAGNAKSVQWFGPLRYVAEQAGVWLVYWFVAWVAAMWRFRPTRSSRPETSYLWWSSMPLILVFGLVTFKTPGQVNWPIAGYIGGMVLTAGWLAAELKTASERRRRILVGGLGLVMVVGAVFTLILHYPSVIRKPAAFAAELADRNPPCPLRRFDPTARLRGWQSLAAAVDQARSELVSRGESPNVATTFWATAGELAFYSKGHPSVYCIGPAIGQRVSQYDLWHPNPIWDAEEFRGQTFIVVGDLAANIEAAFDSVESSRRVWYCEAGQPVNYWQISVCRGYRGFGPPSDWPGRRRY